MVEDKKVKEEVPPASAPAAPQDPMAVLLEMKGMLQQCMQMLQGNGSEQAKTEAMAQIKVLSEKMASMEATVTPHSKGKVGESSEKKEETIREGNREIMLLENDKKFVVEKTAGGKSSFWME